jgi:hypothetical protein
VAIKVDNSIDGPDQDPNLIVRVVVIDEDDADPAPAPSSLQAALRGQPAASGPEPLPMPQVTDLACLWLAEDGSPRGIASGSSHWPEAGSLRDASDLTWSFDGTRLLAVGRDRIHVATESGVMPLVSLAGASAADGGPALELEIDSEPAVLEVIAAIGRGAGGLEDVFAIYVDAGGRALGLENLTRSADVREIDAAWLHDGSGLALLERSERDVVAVRPVVFGAGRELPVHAALGPAGRVVWQAEAGSLRDVSAATTRELLAVSAWTGRDWDVLCVDGRGEAVNLGAEGVDESAPSWSRGDRRLAVERRCADDRCGPLPIAIWELEHPPGTERCPRVAGARPLESAGARPAWRP